MPERAMTISERLGSLEARMQAKLLEPVQHGPCQHATDCPGHTGEVHWLGMSAALDEVRALKAEVEAEATHILRQRHLHTRDCGKCHEADLELSRIAARLAPPKEASE